MPSTLGKDIQWIGNGWDVNCGCRCGNRGPCWCWLLFYTCTPGSKAAAVGRREMRRFSPAVDNRREKISPPSTLPPITRASTPRKSASTKSTKEGVSVRVSTAQSAKYTCKDPKLPIDERETGSYMLIHRPCYLFIWLRAWFIWLMANSYRGRVVQRADE